MFLLTGYCTPQKIFDDEDGSIVPSDVSNLFENNGSSDDGQNDKYMFQSPV